MAYRSIVGLFGSGKPMDCKLHDSAVAARAIVRSNFGRWDISV
jgi:hypothetical protein